MLNNRRTRIGKSRQGRPKVAHGFNRGLRVEEGQSPEGATGERGWTCGSSLTGLVWYSRHNPEMNRWATVERPFFGTWTQDTVIRYHGEGNTIEQLFFSTTAPQTARAASPTTGARF